MLNFKKNIIGKMNFCFLKMDVILNFFINNMCDLTVENKIIF